MAGPRLLRKKKRTASHSPDTTNQKYIDNNSLTTNSLPNVIDIIENKYTRPLFFLTPETIKTRRNLLISSSIPILIYIFGLEISSINQFGISLSNITKDTIMKICLIISFYELLIFISRTLRDYTEWKGKLDLWTIKQITSGYNNYTYFNIIKLLKTNEQFKTQYNQYNKLGILRYLLLLLSYPLIASYFFTTKIINIIWEKTSKIYKTKKHTRDTITYFIIKTYDRVIPKAYFFYARLFKNVNEAIRVFPFQKTSREKTIFSVDVILRYIFVSLSSFFVYFLEILMPVILFFLAVGVTKNPNGFQWLLKYIN